MGGIGASDAESEGGRTRRWTPHKGRSSRRGERECEPPTPVGAGIGNGEWDKRTVRRRITHQFYLRHVSIVSRGGPG
jgi:hypothetical protein